VLTKKIGHEFVEEERSKVSAVCAYLSREKNDAALDRMGLRLGDQLADEPQDVLDDRLLELFKGLID